MTTRIIREAAEAICRKTRLSTNGKYADEFEQLIRQVLADSQPALVAAAKNALAHVRELREAWQRGTLEERQPSERGWLSNINVEVEVALRDALQER